MAEEWAIPVLRREIIDEWGPQSGAEVYQQVMSWHERGDMIAVYADQRIGHPLSGQLQLASYGSSDAQFEREQYPDGPPEQMPDMRGKPPNWMYRLRAVVSPAAAEVIPSAEKSS